MNNDRCLAYFFKNIRILRIASRLSLKQMAQIAGVGVGTLRKLEAGILPPRLSCDFVFAVADHFHLPAYILFCPLPGIEEFY